MKSATTAKTIGPCLGTGDIRTNVSTTLGTGDVKDVKTLIKKPPDPDVVSVGNTGALQTALTSITSVGSLDLISHSKHGVLHFGTYFSGFYATYAPPAAAGGFQAFATWLKDEVSELGITRVRLLGCRTALTVAGQNAMRALQETLNVPVIGTTDIINVSCFNERGFNDLSSSSFDFCFLLADCDMLQKPREDVNAITLGTESDIAFDARALPTTPYDPLSPPFVTGEDEAFVLPDDGIDQLTRNIATRKGRVVRGLLALPEWEILITSPGGLYRHVEVFFDWGYVRTFPFGTERPGVIYPVENRRELEKFVRQFPAPPPREPY